MLGMNIWRWMYHEDRGPDYLCQRVGLDCDELFALMVGAAAPRDELLAKLAEVTKLPMEQLAASAADQAVGASELDPRRCYKVEEVARFLGVSLDTVRSEMDSGALGYIIVGQRVRRIPHQALEERLGRWRDPDRGHGHGR